MEVKAEAKSISVSPSKVKLVVDLVRGKKVDEALTILKFTQTPTAKAVSKVIKSAAANAENNFQLAPSDLRVLKIAANKGMTLKRFRPRSRGMVSPILKRYCNITVIVSEQES